MSELYSKQYFNINHKSLNSVQYLYSTVIQKAYDIPHYPGISLSSTVFVNVLESLLVNKRRPLVTLSADSYSNGIMNVVTRVAQLTNPVCQYNHWVNLLFSLTDMNECSTRYPKRNLPFPHMMMQCSASTTITPGHSHSLNYSPSLNMSQTSAEKKVKCFMKKVKRSNRTPMNHNS